MTDTDLNVLEGAYEKIASAWSMIDYAWRANGKPDDLTAVWNATDEASNLLEALLRHEGVVFEGDD